MHARIPARHTCDAPARTSEGRSSVSADTLQLYDAAYAARSDAAQSPGLVTVTPTHEQPDEKQWTRSANVGYAAHTLQLSATLHDRFTVARRSTSSFAARLICANRPFSPLRDELYGTYAPSAVTSRSKWTVYGPLTTLPTLTYRIACGAQASGPMPPRLE